MAEGGGERLDVHNASVNERIARAGRCAMTNLRTGQVCILPFRHREPCQFVSPREPAVEHLLRDPRPER